MTDAFSSRRDANNVLNPNTAVKKVAGSIAVLDTADIVAPLLADIAANADFWDHADSGSTADFFELEDAWLQVDVILREAAGDEVWPGLTKRLENILASSLVFTFANNLSGEDAVSYTVNGKQLVDEPRSFSGLRFLTDDVAKIALTKQASAATLSLTTAATDVTVDYEFRLHLSWR